MVLAEPLPVPDDVPALLLVEGDVLLLPEPEDMVPLPLVEGEVLLVVPDPEEVVPPLLLLAEGELLVVPPLVLPDVEPPPLTDGEVLELEVPGADVWALPPGVTLVLGGQSCELVPDCDPLVEPLLLGLELLELWAMTTGAMATAKLSTRNRTVNFFIKHYPPAGPRGADPS